MGIFIPIFRKEGDTIFEHNSNYYSEDARLGDRCFINQKDTYEKYNADLESLTVAPREIETEFTDAPGSSRLLQYGTTIKTRGLSLHFYVGGPSEEAAQTNISNLLVAAEKCLIQTDTSRFEYDAILQSFTDEYTGIEYYHSVTLEFAVARRFPLVTIPITKTTQIHNDGNVESGVRYEITPTKNISSFTVNGIKVKNLVGGKTFVIDGINGKVIQDDVNRFQDTDIIEFPKIAPGWNEIKMSESVNLKVCFYPVVR